VPSGLYRRQVVAVGTFEKKRSLRPEIIQEDEPFFDEGQCAGKLLFVGARNAMACQQRGQYRQERVIAAPFYPFMVEPLRFFEIKLGTGLTDPLQLKFVDKLLEGAK